MKNVTIRNESNENPNIMVVLNYLVSSKILTLKSTSKLLKLFHNGHDVLIEVPRESLEELFELLEECKFTFHVDNTA